jgi:hypothetical protein
MHYIEKFSHRHGVPIGVSGILFWLTFAPYFVFNDIRVTFCYMFSEPQNNSLFTYIRVRQLSEVVFEALPQSIMQVYVAFALQSPLVDGDLVWISLLSSAEHRGLFSYDQAICQGAHKWKCA